MRSVKIITLAILLSVGALHCARATYVVLPTSTYTYEFDAITGDQVFDGSTITIGVYGSLGIGSLYSWDIKDPNFPNDFTPASAAALGYIFSSTLVSFSPTSFDGTFDFSYFSSSKGTWQDLKITGDGTGAGGISDTDPYGAQGKWSPVPDAGNTLLLTAMAVAALAGVNALSRFSRRMPNPLWKWPGAIIKGTVAL